MGSSASVASVAVTVVTDRQSSPISVSTICGGVDKPAAPMTRWAPDAVRAFLRLAGLDTPATDGMSGSELAQHFHQALSQSLKTDANATRSQVHSEHYTDSDTKLVSCHELFKLFGHEGQNSHCLSCKFKDERIFQLQKQLKVSPCSPAKYIQPLHSVNCAHVLPTSLQAFVPLQHMPSIIQLVESKELRQAQLALQQNPGDETAASVLTQKLQQLAAALRKELVKRCHEEDILETCRAVERDGNCDCERVYDSVWELTRHGDPDGLCRYKAVAAQLPMTKDVPKQRARDPVQLFQDAARISTLFRQTVATIVHNLHRTNQSAIKLVLPKLKQVSRIVEKGTMNTSDPGSVDTVFDVVRGMATCSSMGSVAAVLKEVLQNSSITVVRAKDRFVASPSRGGWRDCLLLFYHNEDPAKHICELQVVHKSMKTAREDLPGHAVYARIRNAIEIQEMILRHYLPTWTVQESLRAGATDHDLLANFDDTTLRAAGQGQGWFIVFYGRCNVLLNLYCQYQQDSMQACTLPCLSVLERLALMCLYNDTSGMDWIDQYKQGWGTQRSVSTWGGVTTDANSYVIGVELPDGRVSGTNTAFILADSHELCSCRVDSKCVLS